MNAAQPNVPYGFCQCGCGEPAPIATHTETRRGVRRGEPYRFIHGHRVRLERRSVRHVEEDRGHDTPCWIWQLSIATSTGYGLGKAEGQRVLAHRFYYEQAKGPIPEGLEIDHLCRVRACVNPDHLEAVTHAENVRRGAQARPSWKRSRGPYPYHASSILIGLLTTSLTPSDLADMVGYSETFVYHVRRGKAWNLRRFTA